MGYLGILVLKDVLEHFERFAIAACSPYGSVVGHS